MTNYARGADKERELVEMFRDAGATVVLRSAGSHGEIDVVAAWPSLVLFTQLKYGDHPSLTKADKRTLLVVAYALPHVGIIAALWGKRAKPDFLMFSPLPSTRATVKRILSHHFPDSSMLLCEEEPGC